MRCPYCNNVLPDDSMFCQFCGKSLSANSIPFPNVSIKEKDSLVASQDNGEIKNNEINKLPQTEKVTKHNNSKLTKNKGKKRCKKCGALINNDTKKCTGCGKQYLRLSRFFLFLLSFICICSIILNGYLYINGKKTKAEDSQTITQLRNSIVNYKDTITRKNREINEQYAVIQKTSNKAAKYDQLYKEYSNFINTIKNAKNLGYASENFRTTESIIFVSRKEKDHKIKLYAHWSKGGMVDVSYDNQYATVSFDKNSWTTSTTLTINPHSIGISVVTFSNDADGRSFDIIIIVTG